MPRKKKVKIKRKRKEPELIDMEGFVTCRTNQIVKGGKLRYNEKRVYIQVCKERSQGIVRRPDLKEYIEENCLGCTKWIEKLRNDN